MAQSDYEQNAAFHNEFAAQYDKHLTRSPYDVLARQAFVDLVARYVPVGSTLLDFGCGTGLDAQHYAQRGYRVLAYDNSPGMMAQLESRCADEIASGNIIPFSMDYSSFLDRFPRGRAPDAVVANFAVLNLIQDLEPLFDTLARHLAPPGWIIVSILNPVHWSKLKMPRRWRNVLRAPSAPPIYMTEPYTSYLHLVPALLRAAHRFQLVGRANAGKCVRYDAVMPNNEVRLWEQTGSHMNPFERALWQTAAHRLLGHFVFLVLRRDP
jgi:SAM-dependent methyltransferase